MLAHSIEFVKWAMAVDGELGGGVKREETEGGNAPDVGTWLKEWKGIKVRGDAVDVIDAGDDAVVLCGVCNVEVGPKRDFTSHSRSASHRAAVETAHYESGVALETLNTLVFINGTNRPPTPPAPPKRTVSQSSSVSPEPSAKRRVTLLSSGHLENPKTAIPISTKAVRSKDMAPPKLGGFDWKPPPVMFTVNMDDEDVVEEVVPVERAKTKEPTLTPEQKTQAQVLFRRLLLSDEAAYVETDKADLKSCDHILVVAMHYDHGNFFQLLEAMESTGKKLIPDHVGVLAISPTRDARPYFSAAPMARLLYHNHLSIEAPTMLTGKNPVENYMQIKILQIDKILPARAGITVVGNPTIHANMAQLVTVMATKGRSIMVMDCPANNLEHFFFKLHSRLANRSSNRLYSVTAN